MIPYPPPAVKPSEKASAKPRLAKAESPDYVLEWLTPLAARYLAPACPYLRLDEPDSLQ